MPLGALFPHFLSWWRRSPAGSPPSPRADRPFSAFPTRIRTGRRAFRRQPRTATERASKTGLDGLVFVVLRASCVENDRGLFRPPAASEGESARAGHVERIHLSVKRQEGSDSRGESRIVGKRNEFLADRRGFRFPICFLRGERPPFRPSAG